MAVTKSISSNADNTVWNGHAGQVCAPIERKLTDAGNAVRNGHKAHRFTVVERIVADGSQAFRKDASSDLFTIVIPRSSIIIGIVRHRTASLNGQPAGIQIKGPGQIAAVAFGPTGAGDRAALFRKIDKVKTFTIRIVLSSSFRISENEKITFWYQVVIVII